MKLYGLMVAASAALLTTPAAFAALPAEQGYGGGAGVQGELAQGGSLRHRPGSRLAPDRWPDARDHGHDHPARRQTSGVGRDCGSRGPRADGRVHSGAGGGDHGTEFRLGAHGSHAYGTSFALALGRAAGDRRGRRCPGSRAGGRRRAARHGFPRNQRTLPELDCCLSHHRGGSTRRRGVLPTTAQTGRSR